MRNGLDYGNKEDFDKDRPSYVRVGLGISTGRGGAGCGKARRQPWWLAYGEKGCASGKGLSSARPPLNFSALARVQAKMFVFAFLTSLTRKN